MKLAVIHSSLLQLPTVSKFSDNGVFYVFYPYCLPNLAPNIHPSPGQPQDVISPTYPASAPGAPHTKTCLEHLIPLREKIKPHVRCDKTISVKKNKNKKKTPTC